METWSMFSFSWLFEIFLFTSFGIGHVFKTWVTHFIIFCRSFWDSLERGGKKLVPLLLEIKLYAQSVCCDPDHCGTLIGHYGMFLVATPICSYATTLDFVIAKCWHPNLINFGCCHFLKSCDIWVPPSWISKDMVVVPGISWDEEAAQGIGVQISLGTTGMRK